MKSVIATHGRPDRRRRHYIPPDTRTALCGFTPSWRADWTAAPRTARTCIHCHRRRNVQMKMELIMKVSEAKKLAAQALGIVPIAGQTLEVTSVEWPSYASEVTFTLETKQPEIEPAPGASE